MFIDNSHNGFKFVLTAGMQVVHVHILPHSSYSASLEQEEGVLLSTGDLANTSIGESSQQVGFHLKIQQTCNHSLTKQHTTSP